MPAIEAERQALESVMTEPFRAGLGRLIPEVLRRAETDPVKEYLEGAELTGVRCALFTAGDLEAVKKLVQGETGSSFRVAGKVKIRELMTFAVSEDLAALRMDLTPEEHGAGAVLIGLGVLEAAAATYGGIKVAACHEVKARLAIPASQLRPAPVWTSGTNGSP